LTIIACHVHFKKEFQKIDRNKNEKTLLFDENPDTSMWLGRFIKEIGLPFAIDYTQLWQEPDIGVKYFLIIVLTGSFHKKHPVVLLVKKLNLCTGRIVFYVPSSKKKHFAESLRHSKNLVTIVIRDLFIEHLLLLLHE